MLSGIISSLFCTWEKVKIKEFFILLVFISGIICMYRIKPGIEVEGYTLYRQCSESLHALSRLIPSLKCDLNK